LCINEQKFCTELGISANTDRESRAINHGWAAGDILTTADVLIMKEIAVDKAFT